MSCGGPSRARATMEAGRTAGACRLFFGGLPDAGSDAGDTEPGARDDLPRGAIVLPDTPPHPSQLQALDLIRGHRRVALAGRVAQRPCVWSRRCPRGEVLCDAHAQTAEALRRAFAAVRMRKP